MQKLEQDGRTFRLVNDGADPSPEGERAAIRERAGRVDARVNLLQSQSERLPMMGDLEALRETWPDTREGVRRLMHHSREETEE